MLKRIAARRRSTTGYRSMWLGFYEMKVLFAFQIRNKINGAIDKYGAKKIVEMGE